MYWTDFWNFKLFDANIVNILQKWGDPLLLPPMPVYHGVLVTETGFLHPKGIQSCIKWICYLLCSDLHL